MPKQNHDGKKPANQNEMKKLSLNMALVGIAASAYGQGQMVFDNIGNSSTNPAATANGLFWLSTSGTPVLINQDFNAALYGGANSSSLDLLSIVLLSNGSAVGDNYFGPGTFVEPAPNVYTIQGAIESAFFQVQAWTGNFNSYAAAVAGGAPAAQSPIFINPVSIAPGPPQSLYGMPAMVLAVPEPSTFALAALGGFCALLLRRCRKKVASDS